MKASNITYRYQLHIHRKGNPSVKGLLTVCNPVEDLKSLVQICLCNKHTNYRRDKLRVLSKLTMRDMEGVISAFCPTSMSS